MVNIDEIVAQSVAAHTPKQTVISNLELCFSPTPTGLRAWGSGWDGTVKKNVYLTQEQINALVQAGATPGDPVAISDKLTVRKIKGWILVDGKPEKLPEIKLPEGWGLN